ncbi:hypothetical protein G6F70_000183 [Rhizopus microsporus]|nr:hypothetical protein G6F71_001463 [Rhizopus microsporus]KAG1204731.1 hypothetical protein G6F70_000183 [Rhizopus microsporus]KAG1216100.1 hypothetical protein G6F69_000420 [Rhizopus microsporus]KAG1237070.1 hypothetical protein G6F67_001488 [Rhizopus microsporus]KAG1269683.1 hypothetical protein G6F68_000101 [Rhizopus microsporus]
MPIRSFSTSLIPFLRSDLSVDIRDAFLDTIYQVMISVSDYIIAYGNNTVELEEQNGVNVQEILPKDFSVQDDIVHFPLPLNKDCTPTVALEKELANLFKSGHLQTIHAHYFGSRGVDIDKQMEHPFENILFDALSKKEMMVDESIEPYLMKMALNKHMANFKTLWSNKFRYIKLLNRVITVLLRIHLAPKHERLKTTLSPTSDDDEAATLEIAADIHPIAAQEVTALEDQTIEISKGATRRRMNCLRAIIRQVIFKQFGHKVNERHMNNTLSAIKPDELHACVLITDFLMPYLPPGDKLQHIMHQIPLFLMANDLFQCCGYTHFMAKLVPLTTPHKLLAFKLDALSFYTIFCSKNDGMETFDFDSMQIKSREIATEFKDAVFSSFFSILTKLYHFVQVRANGYMKNQTSVDSSISFQERHVERKREFIEHETSSNTAVLQANIDALKRQLLQLNSQRRSLLINNNVHKLKNEWIYYRSRRLTYTEEVKNNEIF